MVVAAYLVGGFLVASVYAVGLLRGRDDRYHRLGLLIPLTVAAIATPIQMVVGDTLARWVYTNQPGKFAAIELVPETKADVPETLLGHLNANGTVSGGIPIPGMASWLSDPKTGTATVVQGRNAWPVGVRAHHRPGQRGPPRVGSDDRAGHRPVPPLGVVRPDLVVQARLPRSKWFLRAVAVSGVASVVTMEAGWVVTEVGRQPWIVYNYMKVADAVTGNTGIWITFLGVVVLYLGVAITTVLVLQRMSRKYRQDQGFDETDTPYGPSGPAAPQGSTPADAVPVSMSTAVAVILFVGVTAYALFGGADFGAGFWDLIAGGARRGERPRAQIDHSIGPVWEANHVWLIFCLVVLWTSFPTAFASITLTLFVPLSLAAFGIVLRGASFAFRKAVFATRDRRNFGAAFASSSVLVPFCMGAVAGAIATGRVPAGGKAGDPIHSWINPTSLLGGLLAVVVVAYLSAVYLVWDARRSGDDEMVEYFRRRAVLAAVAAGVVSLGGIFVLHHDAPYLYHGLTTRALPWCSCLPLCGLASLVLLVRGALRFARLLSVGAVAAVVLAWGVAQWPYVIPQTMKVSTTAAPSGTLDRRAGGLRRGRGAGHPVAGPALRARPAQPAARRERAEPIAFSHVRLRDPAPRAQGDRREALDRVAAPLAERGAEGPPLRRREVRELPLLPRAHLRDLLLLASEAAHPGRGRVVVPVVGEDRRVNVTPA